MASCTEHGEWPQQFLACNKCFENGDPSRLIPRRDSRARRLWQVEGEELLPPAVQESIRKTLEGFGEIPDRNSPEDFPEGYVLTRQEIVGGILKVLEASRSEIAPALDDKGLAQMVAFYAAEKLTDDSANPHQAEAFRNDCIKLAHAIASRSMVAERDAASILDALRAKQCSPESLHRDRIVVAWADILSAFDVSGGRKGG